MGSWCGSKGDPITYKELIPPETRDFRKGLYDYLGGTDPKYGQQIDPYPGKLPYTQAPDPGQMAAMNTIMQMLGYGGYQWPGMPGQPSVDGGGGGNIPAPDIDEEEAKKKKEKRQQERKDRFKPDRPGRGSR